jgi:hypothetical protein
MWRWLLAGLLSLPQSEAQRRYLSLAEATLRNPITHEELRAALLSAEGVASVRAVFEQSIAESLESDGALVTPELGGESMLDSGRLILVPYPDPVHPIVRRMVELKGDPSQLLAYLESTPDGRALLKGTGGLHALLYQMTRSPPTEPQAALLTRVIAGAIASRFKTWTADPAIQARMIERTEWRGRYVGFWHIHPPRFLAGKVQSGIEPSLQDMQNAVMLGQFLTLVFQPGGFDAYDLAPLGRTGTPSLKHARVVSFRSADWGPHFERIGSARPYTERDARAPRAAGRIR